MDTRRTDLQTLTRKLVISTLAFLAVIMLFFFTNAWQDTSHSFITLIIFGCGLVGGFVSIQQRIHKVGDRELGQLAHSWFSVLLIPLYGGIFALILHIIFVSHIVTGSLFPAYYTPAFGTPPTIEDFRHFFLNTLPASGVDTAKLIFWSFCAGFSERLVPQIVQNIQDRGQNQANASAAEPVTDEPEQSGEDKKDQP